MTDPDHIAVDPGATYVRLRGHHGASKIGNPLVDEDDAGGWRGAIETVTEMLNGGGPDHRLDVDHVTRGGWGFPYVETRDDALVEALAREGHEPLSADEFAALLVDAPSFTYLRTPKPRTAERATRQYQTLETVGPVEFDAPTVNMGDTENEQSGRDPP